jgi:hypothetical protein
MIAMIVIKHGVPWREPVMIFESPFRRYIGVLRVGYISLALAVPYRVRCSLAWRQNGVGGFRVFR